MGAINWRMTQRLVHCASLCLLCVAAGSGLACGTSDVPRSAHGSQRAASHTVQAPLLTRYFSLLATPAEQPPLGVIQSFAPLEVTWSAAQRLPVVTPQMWAVQARDSLCLVEVRAEVTGNVACKRIGRAVREGTYIAVVPTTAPNASQFRSVVGLVPDGVVGVAIVSDGSWSRSVPVTENTFSLTDKDRGFPEAIKLVWGRASDT
jgi:hypothetical protein